jgi:hypothetical protein
MGLDSLDSVKPSRRAILQSASVATGVGSISVLRTILTGEPTGRDGDVTNATDSRNATADSSRSAQSSDSTPTEPSAIAATTAFDSGGGVEIAVDDETDHVTLTLADDADYHSFGYLHFRLDGVQNTDVSFEVTNLDDSRMPHDYRLQYTSNLTGEWQRMNESVGDGFSHTFDDETVYISNYKAYPYWRTVERVKELEASSPAFVDTDVIGYSHEGREMHAVRIANPDADEATTQDVVCIARQHPGEVEGSWHMDAMIDRVLEAFQRRTTGIEAYVFHFLPNANPDGMYAGHHRHCRQGYDLNRRWNGDSPVEIEHLKTYLRDRIDDLYWGFDLHSSTNPEFDAAIYSHQAVTAADRDVIKAIAAHSQSYTDRTRASTYSGGAFGFVADEFDATMVVTEAWTYHEYSAEALATEGERFLAEVVPLED